MRWSNFVTWSEVLWLSCLRSGYASILPTNSLVQRQTPPSPDGFVYRGDGRSPREIRGTGGFQPQGNDWANYDPSFDLDRHYTAGPNGCGLDEFDEPNFVFRTAYVSTALERSTAESYGQWLYEIRATPNILDGNFSEGEVMALGGIHWRQIRRYTRMRDATDNRVDETRWINNPDYDAETYERGPNASRCRVSTTFPAVLAGDSDSTSSDSSNSGEESGEARPQRRLFNAADIFMDQTPGTFELYGEFPPSFTQYAPRDDVPGPDHPAPPEAADAQVGNLLQHYIDMGVQELDRLFPDGNRVLQELFRDINSARCPALTGFGSHLGRSDLKVAGRARRAAAGKQGCCKMLSIFRKKTHKKGAKLDVELCKNSPLNPPCTTVKAPRGKCVAVTEDYRNDISGVKVHDAAGICRFYSKPGCEGEYFEGGHHGVDLYKSRSNFSDKVASFVCDTLKTNAAPERWEWTPESEKTLCARVDKLSLDFELANSYGSGTYDKIKLDFEGAAQKPHVIVEDPPSGYKTSQEINMVDIFGMETVALDRIKRLRLLDELTNRWFGGDAWDVFGITLKARCAGSGINIVLDKFRALDKCNDGLKLSHSCSAQLSACCSVRNNKELQAKPTEPGRFQYNRDWEVWADKIEAKDWAAKPLCSHFQSLNVNLHIADENWAGTDNSLYAKVGAGRFLIARHPSRREVFTVDIGLEKAYSTKLVPVPKVELVGITSEGGHDAVLPKEVTVYGICSGAHTSLSVKQEIKDWIYDGQQLNIKLAPEMWVKA